MKSRSNDEILQEAYRALEAAILAKNDAARLKLLRDVEFLVGTAIIDMEMKEAADVDA